MDNVRDITEVMAEKVLLAYYDKALIDQGVVRGIAEAMKKYADTLTQEATKNIVSMTFQLEGYNTQSKIFWKIITDINKMREHYSAGVGNEDIISGRHVVKDLESILKSAGLLIEGQEDAQS